MDDFEFLLVEVFGLQKIELIRDEKQQGGWIMHQSTCRRGLSISLTPL